MLVIATVDGSNLANNIKKQMEFSVNIPSKYMMKEIEGAGFFSGIDKLGKLNLEYIIGKTIDAPLIDKCPIK